MNGKQRIEAAFSGCWPDKVPIMLHNFMLAAAEAGLTMKLFRSDPRAAARAFVEAVEKYRYDGVVVDFDTATLAGAVGVPVDFPEREPARCLRGALDSLEQVSELDAPDVAGYWGVQVWLETVNLLVDRIGDEVLIRGNCDQCPFSLAGMMRGQAAWMMDLLDPGRRPLVFRLLDYCADATAQFVELMISAGAHMVSNGDSPAGPELVSPAMYREFALPYERRLAEVAHGADTPYVLHICGDTAPILEGMVATGADGLELDYRTDAQRAHDLFQERVVFLGNIDPSGVLTFGDPSLVSRNTEELLKLFSDSPRFVLNAGCAIPPLAPEENLEAMIAVARAFR